MQQQEPIANYKAKFVLEGHERGVSSVKFSPDGKKLATASNSNTSYLNRKEMA
jgi:WD40 repeat protein